MCCISDKLQFCFNLQFYSCFYVSEYCCGEQGYETSFYVHSSVCLNDSVFVLHGATNEGEVPIIIKSTEGLDDCACVVKD